MVAIRSSAVARLSLDFIAAPPIQVSRSFRSRRSHPRQQGPEQPTRSGRSLFPATPMISGAAIAVGYRLRREVDPSESRLNRNACPNPTSVLPPTSLSHVAGGAPSGISGVRLGRQRGPGGDQRERCAGFCPADCFCKQPHSPTVPQDLGGHSVHRRFGISGVELCDDHHTLPPLVFLVLPPVFGPLLRALLSSHLHESLKGPTGG